MVENRESQKFNLCKVDEIAKLFRKTVRRIQQLTQEGILETVQDGRSKKYDLKQTVQKYIAYIEEKTESKHLSKEFEKKEMEKLIADVEFKQAKAKTARLKADEFEGKMHSSDDVEEVTNDLVFTIKNMLLSMPSRLAIDIAAIKTAPEASERVKKEVMEILNHLAEYKYDPTKYSRKVRERAGMNDEAPDQSSDENDDI